MLGHDSANVVAADYPCLNLAQAFSRKPSAGSWRRRCGYWFATSFFHISSCPSMSTSSRRARPAMACRSCCRTVDAQLDQKYIHQCGRQNCHWLYGTRWTLMDMKSMEWKSHGSALYGFWPGKRSSLRRSSHQHGHQSWHWLYGTS